MALAPAITDLEQLKTHPAVARLLAWNASVVAGVKFDREEMTITWIVRTCARLAPCCAMILRAPSTFFPT